MPGAADTTPTRDVEGTVRAAVQPTEEPSKVEAAVRNVFPRAELERTAWGLEGLCGDLARFAALVREQRIPDTARGQLRKGMEGARLRFTLAKQAAAVGRLNFAAREGPLGDLHVEVRAASEEALAAWVEEVAPDTRAWSLEARGLTERRLREQGDYEENLDALDHAADR